MCRSSFLFVPEIHRKLQETCSSMTSREIGGIMISTTNDKE